MGPSLHRPIDRDTTRAVRAYLEERGGDEQDERHEDGRHHVGQRRLDPDLWADESIEGVCRFGVKSGRAAPPRTGS